MSLEMQSRGLLAVSPDLTDFSIPSHCLREGDDYELG